MRISEESLEFAKNHITNFYDSDFFVKPFEFNAIWAKWEDVKNYFLNNDIQNLEIISPLSLPAPKHNGGFRIVHQLDPLNSLIYTALAHEVAEIIEANRVPIDEHVACSYRINIDEKGSFFGSGNGYQDYRCKSEELASIYDFVLVSDISDFYNQIYLHRLQNSISSCNSSFYEISREIESFITKLNNGVSKGIPVGPAASIIFAEACLIDVDQFILDNGFKYTRYVDDIRIFSNSKIELLCFLEKLSFYLYSNHRMSIAGSKTEILSTNEFVEKYLNDPEELEKRRIHDALEEINLEINQVYPNFESLDLDELPSEDKIRIQAETLKSLLDDIINLGQLDLGLSRHILRRSGRLRTRAIFKDILENLDFFAPVIRDVIIYFNRVTTEKVIERFEDSFVEMLGNSETKNLSFVGYWLRHFFAKYPNFYKIREIRDFLKASNDIRNIAFCAKQNKLISWVREHKDRASSYGPWGKRSVMFSSLALSDDERRNWMKNIEISSNNLLDKILASYLRSY